MILPDHPTPVRLRTHTSDPVPFLLYDSTKQQFLNELDYDEVSCASTQKVFKTGPELAAYFFNK